MIVENLGQSSMPTPTLTELRQARQYTPGGALIMYAPTIQPLAAASQYLAKNNVNKIVSSLVELYPGRAYEMWSRVQNALRKHPMWSSSQVYNLIINALRGTPIEGLGYASMYYYNQTFNNAGEELAAMKAERASLNKTWEDYKKRYVRDTALGWFWLFARDMKAIKYSHLAVVNMDAAIVRVQAEMQRVAEETARGGEPTPPPDISTIMEADGAGKKFAAFAVPAGVLAAAGFLL